MLYNCHKWEYYILVVRILHPERLQKFWEHHSNARRQLESWYDQVRKENWETPAKVREQHPRTSIVGNSRAVFRIRGHSYRLVAEVDYERGIVDIRFIGTHAEYNNINVLEV